MSPPALGVGCHHEAGSCPAVRLRALIVALKRRQLLLIALNVVMTAGATVPRICAERNALSILDRDRVDLALLRSTDSGELQVSAV